ncbi:MAG: RsmB/NOP family class I SAM-dependent RNA methyltransferase [bacterium]|nr:RsmB/NOP family class I SAM-dependent RNA methyltransferase [bacterium]
MEFDKALIENYSKITDWNALKKHLLTPSRKSIRVNTLKTTVNDVKKALSKEWKLEQIPWCKEGFWIKGKREDLGNIPEHNEGHFYIQEAASMIPATVMQPLQKDSILDMCASPGGKTTQLAAIMQNKGRIVANDIRQDRIAIINRNIERLGVKNCTVSMKPGQRFKDVKFDKILVDAPCSGTGTMRGSQEAIDAWNPEVIKRLSFEQKSLLHHAYCVLRKKGTLVYSTCSMEPRENEAVVDYLLKRHKKTELEEIKIPGLKRSEPIVGSFDKRIEKCLRIWPQDNNTDGFFVARIRKL